MHEPLLLFSKARRPALSKIMRKKVTSGFQSKLPSVISLSLCDLCLASHKKKPACRQGHMVVMVVIAIMVIMIIMVTIVVMVIRTDKSERTDRFDI